MPVKDSAAYMREYRKRKAQGFQPVPIVSLKGVRVPSVLETENERLIAEVARLKRELAARPASLTVAGLTPAPGKGRPMTIAFNPAPKPGKK